MEPRLWPLRRAFQGISRAWRDTPSQLFARQQDTTPAVCFDDCDRAYKIAVSYGKTEKLCAQGSAFMGSYAACTDCITENGGDSKDSLRDYVEPKFGQFINYCEGEDTSNPSNPQEEQPQPSATTDTDCDGCITTVMTDYRKNVMTIVLGTEKVPTSSLLDARVFYSTVKETLHVTHHVTEKASPTAASEIDEPDNSSDPNVATIVGPVVPSAVLLIILAFLGLRWYKKREKIKDQEAQIQPDEEAKVEKAQLHSDCVPRPTYELEGSTPIVIDPTSPDGAEMAANEVAAHEMPTEKKLGERRTGENEEGQIMTEESKAEETKAEEGKNEQNRPDESKPGNGINGAAGTSK